ncbi:MAG: MATE family efflux transporter [Lentisphaerae bacterium]|nr:MATE family efflux transporter [Lentisphaerota bacterium]
MALGNDRYQMDMCRGPLLRQTLVFAFPLIVSGMLQLLFNAADLIVVGRFASHQALAAVGATGALTHLIINIFIGMSIGANVLVAQNLGEQNRKDTSRTTHTAIMISLVGGALLAAIGIVLAKPMLRWMDTPPDVLEQATLYMRIYFAGMPLIMLYNFGSAILRALGDTRRPFFFLIISGIINVVLNLFFVLIFHWDVAGVATATVLSQGVAAILILRVLMQLRTACRVKLKTLRIEWKSLRAMMWIGVPAGFQASCFSLSNLVIQSSINLFGSETVAGFTAALTWEVIGFVTAGAIGQTVVSFVGQNTGGKQYHRLRLSIRYCLGLCIGALLAISAVLIVFAEPLLALFNTDPDVIYYGKMRFYISMPLFFTCGMMEVYTSALRGMGRSVIPAAITIFTVCISRIIYITTLWKLFPTLEMLLVLYPATWTLNAVIMAIYLKIVLKKLPDEDISAEM